jgi:ankyrin repeat protein
MSPLYLACQEGHLQVVCTLLETGADVNLCNKDGITPLSIACYEGHLGVVCKLVDYKADVNKTNHDGFSPLQIACQENHLQIVCKLIKNNVDINQCSYKGVSPLYIACQHGKLPVVCKLLEHNVDVNKCDDDGTSALLAETFKISVRSLRQSSCFWQSESLRNKMFNSVLMFFDSDPIAKHAASNADVPSSSHLLTSTLCSNNLQTTGNFPC